MAHRRPAFHPPAFSFLVLCCPLLLLQAEAQYTAAVETGADDDAGADDAFDDDVFDDAAQQGDGGADNRKELERKFLKLTKQDQVLRKRIKTLEAVSQLTVSFTIKAGPRAQLCPGAVTAVSFLRRPVVWCPRSLAAESTGDDVADVESIKAALPLRLQTAQGADGETSAILTPAVLARFLLSLHAMVSAKSPFATMRKIYHANNTGNGSLLSYAQAAVTQYTSAYWSVVASSTRPNVLTIVQSAAGEVFGGFHGEYCGRATSGWQAGEPQNFIFSLTGAGAGAPVKLIKPPGYAGPGGLEMSPSTGLQFSTDLVAVGAHEARVPTNYTAAAPGFAALPPGKSIAGAVGRFAPLHLEVYHLY
jgi:hypothetical protein